MAVAHAESKTEDHQGRPQVKDQPAADRRQVARQCFRGKTFRPLTRPPAVRFARVRRGGQGPTTDRPGRQGPAPQKRWRRGPGRRWTRPNRGRLLYKIGPT